MFSGQMYYFSFIVNEQAGWNIFTSVPGSYKKVLIAPLKDTRSMILFNVTRLDSVRGRVHEIIEKWFLLNEPGLLPDEPIHSKENVGSQ